MTNDPQKCLELPALTDEQWRMLFNAFCAPVAIPTGPPTPSEQAPAQALIVNTVMADNALDELAEDDPRLVEVLGPFLSLSEVQAMAALCANNILWQTGQTPWPLRPTVSA